MEAWLKLKVLPKADSKSPFLCPTYKSNAKINLTVHMGGVFLEMAGHLTGVCEQKSQCKRGAWSAWWKRKLTR